MRTLSILSIGLMGLSFGTACTGGGGGGNCIDEDGDGYCTTGDEADCDDEDDDINPGESESSNSECSDGDDNDCDGDEDEDDSDCPEVEPEDCDNGDVDDDGDGDADCADSDCSSEPQCLQGAELWSFGGTATVDASGGTYSGKTYMIDVNIGVNDPPSIAPDTEICRYEWPTTGTVASTPAVTCADCAFGFALAYETANVKDGEYCATWYDESWDELGINFTVGYASAYTLQTDTGPVGPGPALMMYNDGGDTGSPEWYGIPASDYVTAEYTGGTFNWQFAAGAYYFYYL